MNCTKRVAKVKAVLAKFVPAHSLQWPLFGCSATWKTFLIIRLSDDSWTIGDRTYGLDGVVGGYSTTALIVAHPLADLKYFSHKDAEAFTQWWRELDQQQQEDAEKAKMQETARKYGYNCALRR